MNTDERGYGKRLRLAASSSQDGEKDVTATALGVLDGLI
jgi:hypothetical protein